MSSGANSSRPKAFLRRSAAASVIVLAALAMPTTGRADERPLFISLGETAKAPIGWVEFCIEYDPECKTSRRSRAT